MNKLLMWWMSLRAAQEDAVHWQREAEKWERKYNAAIAVRDQLSQQLEETQAALFAARAPKDILRNLYPKVKPLPKSKAQTLCDESALMLRIPENIPLKKEIFGCVPVVIDPTLPPGTIVFRGADGSVIRIENVRVED